MCAVGLGWKVGPAEGRPPPVQGHRGDYQKWCHDLPASPHHQHNVHTCMAKSWCVARFADLSHVERHGHAGTPRSSFWRDALVQARTAPPQRTGSRAASPRGIARTAPGQPLTACSVCALEASGLPLEGSNAGLNGAGQRPPRRASAYGRPKRCLVVPWSQRAIRVAPRRGERRSTRWAAERAPRAASASSACGHTSSSATRLLILQEGQVSLVPARAPFGSWGAPAMAAAAALTLALPALAAGPAADTASALSIPGECDGKGQTACAQTLSYGVLQETTAQWHHVHRSTGSARVRLHGALSHRPDGCEHSPQALLATPRCGRALSRASC